LHDDGPEIPPEIRTRIELLVQALAYIEPEIQRLRLDDGECISLNRLERLIDLRNKAYHYLSEVEAWIQENESSSQED
jgi:hypothetical protein